MKAGAYFHLLKFQDFGNCTVMNLKLHMKLQKLLHTPSTHENNRLRANLSTHDERVEAIVRSGYKLAEAVNALEVTKEKGYESTQKAASYLRENSRTPIAAMTTALGTVQARVSKLTRAAESELDSFGPELSDLIDSYPSISKQAVFIKRLHDLQVLKHLSSCAKAADALRTQIFGYPEYRSCDHLGKICLAVCKDCEKCTANRKKSEQKELEAQQALSHINGGRKPLPPRNYDINDSQIDHSLMQTWCRVCQLGERLDVPEGTYLLYCDSCNRGTHDACEVLAEYLDAKSDSYWLCEICQRYPQRGLKKVTHKNAPRMAPTRAKRTAQLMPARESSLNRETETRRQSRWDEESLPHQPNPADAKSPRFSLLKHYGDKATGKRCDEAAPMSATLTCNADITATGDAREATELRQNSEVATANDVSRTNIKIME